MLSVLTQACAFLPQYLLLQCLTVAGKFCFFGVFALCDSCKWHLALTCRSCWRKRRGQGVAFSSSCDSIRSLHQLLSQLLATKAQQLLQMICRSELMPFIQQRQYAQSDEMLHKLHYCDGLNLCYHHLPVQGHYLSPQLWLEKHDWSLSRVLHCRWHRCARQ